MIGERLKRARAAAGLSMSKLGKAAGVTAPMIQKYERGLSMPSSSVLIKLAEALNVRTEYFFRPNRIELAGVEYRKKARTPKKVLDQITADVLDQAERWFELKNIWPDFPIPEFSRPKGLPTVHSLDDVEAVAMAVREAWSLGLNPLPDLIDVLESRGILVIVTDIDQAEQFDGLQAQVHGQPIVVVSSHWPGCRQRFTLAHELGHEILQDQLPPDMDEEQACNRFASAFLLPATGVYEHLGASRHSIDMKELNLLKQEYGLSMQAILYRCKDLGVLPESKVKSLFIQFRSNGWHKQEPGQPVPPERTLLFEQLVYRGAAEGLLSDSKAAELLKMPVHLFRRSRMMMEGESA